MDSFLLVTLPTIIIGVIVGFIASRIRPRTTAGGVMTNMLLGVAGSVVGHFVGWKLGVYRATGSGLFWDTFSSSLGAVILLLAHVKIKQLTTGRDDRERTWERATSGPAREPRAPSAASVGDIFMSYAASDRPIAKDLASALEDEGWSVWWDRSIPPGKRFEEVIEAKLRAAKCVIVLWSEASVASRWVKAEAEEAVQRQILIPALIEDVSIPLGFRQIQAANLKDWRRSRTHAGFQSLVGSIADVLGTPKASDNKETPY